jgi:hypothetical protein
MIALDAGTIIQGAAVAVVIYLMVLWIALAFYVARDARRRSRSWLFTILAALLGLVPPFLGALIYLVIRPPRTLDEGRAFALEEQALVAPEPGPEGVRPCPTCGRDIDVDFILCPYCRTQFARRCGHCDRALRLGWSVCPYCAAEVGAPTLSRAGH